MGHSGRSPAAQRCAVQSTICCQLAELLDAEDHEQRRQIRRSEIPRKPRRRKIRPALRIQYAALPYRFTADAALEILLVTTRRSKRWIIPKGWPIKGLTSAKSAAREAFEEAGVRGKIGAKSVGLFKYNKLLDEHGFEVSCEVKVFPLLVKRQASPGLNLNSGWSNGLSRRRRSR